MCNGVWGGDEACVFLCLHFHVRAVANPAGRGRSTEQPPCRAISDLWASPPGGGAADGPERLCSRTGAAMGGTAAETVQAEAPLSVRSTGNHHKSVHTAAGAHLLAEYKLYLNLCFVERCLFMTV